jgi:hypothetical protein
MVQVSLLDPAMDPLIQKKDRHNSLISEIMPISIPQITDPRITLQTFNAPTPPILPGVLPVPEVHMDITLPKQNNPKASQVIIDNEIIKEDHGRGFRNELKSTIESAFFEALEDDWRSPKLENLARKKPKLMKVNIIETPAERLLFSIKASEKSSRLKSHLQKLSDQYEEFDEQVQSKMKNLEFLISKFSQRKLDIIV